MRFFCLLGCISAILFLLSCASRERSQITYKPIHLLYAGPSDTSVARLLHVLDTRKVDLDSFGIWLDTGWYYQPGARNETLESDMIVSGILPVALPHRVSLPNTCLWYSGTFSFQEEGFVFIQADDGAQFFVDGTRRSAIVDGFYPIDAGKVKLTVRVLNNAMSGGLRKAKFLRTDEFEEYQFLQLLHQRQQALFKKAFLFHQLSDQQWLDIQKAIFHPHDESALKTGESYFREFPLLVGPWLTVKDSMQYCVNVLADSSQAVTLRYSTDSLHLINRLSLQDDICSFELETLLPDTKYFYQLFSGKTATQIYSFKTYQSDPQFSFSVWADSQGGWPVFYKLMQRLSNHQDMFSVGVGDLVSHGADENQWQTFFEIISAQSASIPFYLIAGNHDYDGYYEKLVPENFRDYTQHATGYFSWRAGNCAFIALDPNDRFPIGFSDTQQQWFHLEMKKPFWRTATWRFVFVHQPPFSQGWAGYSGEQSVLDLLTPALLEEQKIDVVVSGHTHDYERLMRKNGNQKTLFLIVGGAGGGLEPVESSVQPDMDTVIKEHHMGRFYVTSDSIRVEIRNIRDEIIDAALLVK